jgi:hypothetical protein
MTVLWLIFSKIIQTNGIREPIVDFGDAVGNEQVLF